MVTMTSYAPGTPSWVDLGTSDLEAARAFYGRLFGWEFQEGPPEAGGYAMCRFHDANVAGIGPLMPEQTAHGVPPHWTTYFSTDDADGTAKRIESAGGRILAGPMDVMGEGRLVVAMDPVGAGFGLWQPGRHTGAELVNEPGTLCWNELLTRDRIAARDFYSTVFGFGGDEMDIGGPEPYVLWKVGDRTVGGMMRMPAEVPAEVPSYWLAYFAVASTDDAVRTATDSGAETLYGPVDAPYGRFAVLQDPQGAPFAVIEVSEQTSP